MDEIRIKAVIDVLQKCSKAADWSCQDCSLNGDLDCIEKVATTTLIVIHELLAENLRLHELNKASATGFETLKTDITQRLLIEARKQAFLVGDDQYISIAELEQIIKEI